MIEKLKILAPAAERLRPGGHLLIEIGPAIHEAVQKLLKSDARFEPGPTIKDLARLPRMVPREGYGERKIPERGVGLVDRVDANRREWL